MRLPRQAIVPFVRKKPTGRLGKRNPLLSKGESISSLAAGKGQGQGKALCRYSYQDCPGRANSRHASEGSDWPSVLWERAPAFAWCPQGSHEAERGRAGFHERNCGPAPLVQDAGQGRLYRDVEVQGVI